MFEKFVSSLKIQFFSWPQDYVLDCWCFVASENTVRFCYTAMEEAARKIQYIYMERERERGRAQSCA